MCWRKKYTCRQLQTICEWVHCYFILEQSSILWTSLQHVFQSANHNILFFLKKYLTDERRTAPMVLSKRDHITPVNKILRTLAHASQGQTKPGPEHIITQAAQRYLADDVIAICQRAQRGGFFWVQCQGLKPSRWARPTTPLSYHSVCDPVF